MRDRALLDLLVSRRSAARRRRGANVRNPINSALNLVVSMLALAGLYVLLEAQFVGLIQVMVYAGAIVVLFLFVIMLLNLRGSGTSGAETQPLVKIAGRRWSPSPGLFLVRVLASGRAPWARRRPEATATTRAIGRRSTRTTCSPCELAGVLLLAGIVAARRAREAERSTDGRHLSVPVPGRRGADLPDRRGRRAHAPQHDRDVHVHRADAERRESVAGRRSAARSATTWRARSSRSW